MVDTIPIFLTIRLKKFKMARETREIYERELELATKGRKEHKKESCSGPWSEENRVVSERRGPRENESQNHSGKIIKAGGRKILRCLFQKGICRQSIGTT